MTTALPKATTGACHVEEAFILKVLRDVVDQEILKKVEAGSELESQLEALWDLCVDEATAQAVVGFQGLEILLQASSLGEGRIAEAALGAVANVCSQWVAKPLYELADVGKIARAATKILSTPDGAVAAQALRIVFALLCCTEAPTTVLWNPETVERYVFIMENSLRWDAVRFACDALAQGIVLEARMDGPTAETPQETRAALRRLGALSLCAHRCEELATVIEEGADGAEGDSDPEVVLWSALRLVESLLTILPCSDKEAVAVITAAMAALRAAQRPDAQIAALEVLSVLFEVGNAISSDSPLLRQAAACVQSDADVVEKLVLLLPELDEDGQDVALVVLALLQSARREDLRNHAEALQEAMASFSEKDLDDAGVLPAFREWLSNPSAPAESG